MKKKILIITGVILLLIAGLLIAPNLIDWNQYKTQVADGFESATGNKIDIRGNLSFKLLPSPALSVHDVSLSNVSWGQAQNFLELQSLDIRLELFPLLNGDYKVTSLLLDGGRINLEINKNGQTNWKELFASEESEEQEEREITLDKFLLRNTTISYFDAVSGARHDVSDINAEFVVTSLSGPIEGEGELTYLGSMLDFDFGVARFKSGDQIPIRFKLVMDNDDPGLSFSGTLVSEEAVTAVSGSLTGGGSNAENIIGFLNRAGGDDKVPAGPWRQSYKIDSTVLAVLTEEKTEISLEPLSLSLGKTEASGNVRAISTEALKTDVNLKIGTIGLDVWLGKNEKDNNEPARIPEDVSGTFVLELASAKYQGQDINDIKLKGNLANGVFRMENLSAVLPGETNVSLSGSLKNSSAGITFEGPVHVDTQALRELLTWFEVDISEFPKNRLVRLDFDGRIKYAEPLVEITDTKTMLDSTHFTGAITTYLDESNQFDIAGTVDSLDLDSYYPALLEENKTTGLAGRVASLQESLSALTGFTATIDVKIARLKMMAASVEIAAFKGKLSDNSIAIETLSAASFEGAALSLSGTIDDIPGRMDMDVRTTLQSLTLLRLLQWSEIESPFEERVVPTANIKANLKGNLARTNFDLSGTLSDISFSFIGTMQDLKTKPKLAADLSFSHPKMIEFVRKFSPDYFPAKSLLGAINISARLEGAETNYTLDNLDATLGPAHFQGSLKVEDRQGRPFYGGELSVRVLVMDDFMAKPEAGLIQAAANGGERWSTDEWDLTFLRENDFDIVLRADSLQFRTYRFLNSRIRLRAKDSVLNIEDLNSSFFDGTIEASGTVNVTSVPVLGLTMKLDNVSTERVLRSAAEIESLTGQSNFTGTFKATGQSQKAMIETLGGTVTLSSQEGVIKGINMPQLSERIGTLDSLAAFKGVLGTALERGETPYRYIRTTAKVTKGVIKIDNVESDVDATELGGRGTINLPTWTMDISGALRLKDHPDVPAIGVNMKGRIDEPAVKYDHVALTAFMTKRFTTALFQELLGPKDQPAQNDDTQQPAPSGTTEPSSQTPQEPTSTQQPSSTGQPTTATGQQPAEPTPEEQILKGLIDLLGGTKESEEEPVEDEEGGG